MGEEENRFSHDFLQVGGYADSSASVRRRAGDVESEELLDIRLPQEGFPSPADGEEALFQDIEEDLAGYIDVSVDVGIVRRNGVDILDFIQTILADGTGRGVAKKTKGNYTAYIYPPLPNVYIWDLPAVGNPGDEYLKTLQVDNYEFFLILCDTEFRETEMWLAKEFAKRKKGFFFVRTKINGIFEDPSSSENMSKIRRALVETIDPIFCKYPRFVIANHGLFSLDIQELKSKFRQAVVGLKRFQPLIYQTNSLQKDMQSLCEEWRSAKINIAVVGESGTGKSSFVNAVRNLKAGDKGAARVGVKETTVETIPYPHPDNENVIFWDLPGVGTLNFPRKDYLQAIEVDRYDCFIIISSMRFTVDAKWLSEQVEQRKKPHFVVRTKFDEAIKDKDYKEVKEKITEDIKKNINVSDSRIYVISNVDRHLHDFPRLLEDIILEIPSVKKQSLLLTLSGYSEKLIQMKKDALKPRLLKVATMSGSVGAIPIPGIDTAVDLGILVGEARFYRETFGLSEGRLRQLAEQHEINVERFNEAMSKTRTLTLTKTGIKTALEASRIGLSLATKTTLTSVLEVVVPVVGSVVSGGISFAMMYGFLRKMLNDYASDATSVHALCAKKVADNATKST
ncbi:interferon-inducible GTPase 5-like [Liolophura sinensis]|uniref:interferon-inducible GTPase 5-like n=1 Tax=Liolophura sinensis TaxID=3198878 RepID=UPI0031599392